MRPGTLGRIIAESGDAGTFSALVVGALSIYLGELPPRANVPDLSCLPPMLGEAAITYLLKSQWSNEHKRNLYHFVNVINADGSLGPIPAGRKLAMIHNGNLCGDILKGWAAQVLGCGIAGRAIVTFPKGEVFATFTQESTETLVKIPLAQDQKGVSSSMDALDALMAELNGEDLALTVSWR